MKPISPKGSSGTGRVGLFSDRTVIELLNQKCGRAFKSLEAEVTEILDRRNWLATPLKFRIKIFIENQHIIEVL